jgi:hypothetical protein
VRNYGHFWLFTVIILKAKSVRVSTGASDASGGRRIADKQSFVMAENDTQLIYLRNMIANPTRLPARFPIKEVRRLLPEMVRRLGREIKGLQYSAQELVCQICCTYEKADSADLGSDLDKQRKQLRALHKKLQSTLEGLPDAGALFCTCEEIRAFHRPRGAPGSVRETMRVMGIGDFVSSQKEYYVKASRPDPAAPLECLANSIVTTHKFLSEEIAFIESTIRSTKSVLKSSPHMWWRAGGIYYLLERIYREGSVEATTLTKAHRKICNIMGKLNCHLDFDEAKCYSPAINRAIERMPTPYKNLCDKFLEEWLDLPPKKH